MQIKILFYLNLFSQRSIKRKKDINEKCTLCKNDDNGIKHVINQCEKLKSEKNVLLGEFNEINNTNYEELLKDIEYYYYYS